MSPLIKTTLVATARHSGGRSIGAIAHVL